MQENENGKVTPKESCVSWEDMMSKILHTQFTFCEGESKFGQSTRLTHVRVGYDSNSAKLVK